MTEQESSVEQPSKRAPGRFTTSMAVLKEPVSFPSELKVPQQSKPQMPWKLVIGLLVLGTIVLGTITMLAH